MKQESPELLDLTAKSIVAAREPRNMALATRRRQLGLKQQELAKRVGFKTEGTISHYEHLRYNPDNESAQRIAGELKTTVHQLFPVWLDLFTIGGRTLPRDEAELESDVSRVEIEKAIIRDSLRMSEFDDPLKLAEQNELRNRIYDVMIQLKPWQRRVLELRLGEELTLEEAGEIEKVPVNEIRNTERQALRKLRHPSRTKILKEYLPEGPDSPANTYVLINGTINAINHGDFQRASENIAFIEARAKEYLSVGEKGVIEAITKQEDFPFWSDLDMEARVSEYVMAQGLLVTPARISEKILELNEIRHLKNKLAGVSQAK